MAAALAAAVAVTTIVCAKAAVAAVALPIFMVRAVTALEDKSMTALSHLLMGHKEAATAVPAWVVRLMAAAVKRPLSTTLDAIRTGLVQAGATALFGPAMNREAISRTQWGMCK